MVAFNPSTRCCEFDCHELQLTVLTIHCRICTSVAPEWSKILRYLKFRGTAVPLSLDYGNLVAPYMPLLAKEIRIMGSMVAGRGVHQNMLEFAQRHGLEPMIEIVSPLAA